ncbi:MAG: NAD(P)H-binding protein [Promethearchaeota archaeon]
MLKQKELLVLGATGYIGSRLVPKLLEKGYIVRVGFRSKNKLNSRLWSHHRNLKAVNLNVFDINTLEDAMDEVSTVFYLIHSMEGKIKDFIESDRIAAQNTIIAAENAAIERIIYLGGLGDEKEKLSKHLQSRIEVSRILDSCSIPVTTLRAAIIIGSGSAAFEMMRYLVDRLPIMITPKWLRTKNQPIAIKNVLKYLTDCLDVPETIGEAFDIGGSDIITYKQFMESYIEIMRLPRRLIFPIPFFTPSLSSYWIRLITGIPSSLARPLIDGMKNEVICQDFRIRELIPQELLNHKQAIRLALNPQQYLMHGSYSNYADLPVEWHIPGDPPWSGGLVFQDHRRAILSGSADDLWNKLLQIQQYGNLRIISYFWKFGAFLDSFFRGFKVKIDINEIPLAMQNKIPKRELTLHTDLIIPGYTMLRYRLRRINDKKIELHQIFRIVPKGLIGISYWFAFQPLFDRISKQLIDEICMNINRDSPKFEKVNSTSKPYYLSSTKRFLTEGFLE